MGDPEASFQEIRLCFHLLSLLELQVGNIYQCCLGSCVNSVHSHYPEEL